MKELRNSNIDFQKLRNLAIVEIDSDRSKSGDNPWPPPRRDDACRVNSRSCSDFAKPTGGRCVAWKGAHLLRVLGPGLLELTIYQCPSRLRGAHLMMSSTRRIISAASAAETRTCSLDLNDSRTPHSVISAMLPLTISSPAAARPQLWAARRRVTSSEESNPPLSAIIAGSARSARANASIANAFLPGVFGASASIARAIRISAQPPPGIVRVSVTVRDRTPSASCSDLSASSRTCVDAPRRTMVHASPDLQPEKRTSLSSPTMISSIRSHVPRVASSG
mmetsp:Transcript_37290/g.125947  ORF Transcript_37290/g.125947 Transcript_37290/m.125947 type:complete len:279 (-) Transcript_37290:693-1529(-)